jgi:hypothetical protein
MQDQSNEPAVAYFDCMQLCRAREWRQDGGYGCYDVRAEGVFLKPLSKEYEHLRLSAGLSDEEYAALTAHPTGDPRAPFCDSPAPLQISRRLLKTRA